MPRSLLMAIFLVVCCIAFLAGTCVAGSNANNDATKNFKQPNPKPYDSLANVLKASNQKSASASEVGSNKNGSKTKSSTYASEDQEQAPDSSED